MLNLMIRAINCRPPSVISEGRKGAREASTGATDLMESSWQIFVIPRVLKQPSAAQKTLCVRNKDIIQIFLPPCELQSQSFTVVPHSVPVPTCFRRSPLCRGPRFPFNDLKCSTKTIQKHNKRHLKSGHSLYYQRLFLSLFFFSWPSISNFFFFFSKLVKWKAVESEEKKKN